MLLNKKCIYLGVSLFSAMILGSMSNQTVKADTTSDSTGTSSTQTASSTATPSTSTTSYVAPTGTVVTTQPTGTTPTVASVSLPTSSDSTTSTVPLTTTVIPTTRSTSVTSTSTANLTAPTDTSTSGTASTTATAPTSTSTTGTTTTAPASTSTTSTAATAPTSTSTTSTATTAPATTSTTGTTTTAATTTPGTTATTTPEPDPYALPSNLTDSSIVTFTDPAISSVVKSALGLQQTANVTVGDIKNYNQEVLDLDVNDYKLPTGVSNQIESLNGLQYLTLLPSGTVVYADFNMASDSTADPDLTPLKGVNLNALGLTGNFSDPKAPEIDPTQISELNLNNCVYLGFHGDGIVATNDGITNAQLVAMAPTLIKYSQNGQSDSLYFGNSSITDFTPLKPILSNPEVPGKGFYLSSGNMTIYDPTPIYAVKGQPLTFTAEPNTGLDGEDLAATYHYSATAPADDQVDDNITYLGNDTYIDKSYPNGTTFIYWGTTVEPIVWQDYPNVTVEYVDQNDNPIMNNGQSMVRTIDGAKIGDSYDLTPYSTVAGYTMTGTSSTVLQGKYTQAPQVVILTYKENPVVTPPTTPSTSTTPAVAPTDIVNDVVDVTPQKTSPVQVYDDSGQIVPNTRVSLADTTIQESALINGKRYYMIGTDEWVPASDYDSYKPETGVVRTFGADTELVDSAGKPIDSQLSPNTEWKYNKVITIKGKKYYEVATNEYLAADSAVQFTPVKAGTAITTKIAATVYNSEGQILTTKLPAGSSWKTDGSAVINGIPMCRIATDEWIPAQGVDTYSSVKMTYTVDSETPVYDIDGNVLPNTLKAGTTWKVDQIVMIDGQEYYRVATNEYIKA